MIISDMFRRWWQPDSIGRETVADIEQSVLDHLARHMAHVPVVVMVLAVVVAYLASQSVPVIWPVLWVVVVLCCQIYRSIEIKKLAADRSRSSAERLGACLKLFFMTSAAFALAALFFPFTDEPFRYVLTVIVVGLIIGSIATLQGYPPVFFSFAVPNGLGVSLGWLVSAPQVIPYWVHVVLAIMMLVLLAYLLGFSRDAYQSFAKSQNTNAQLQMELKRAQRINDAKSKVFASASHDLRQPLQSISLLSHKLSDSSIPDHERKSVAATIGVCVDLLSEELDMLLDISDLESDMSANNPELVDVGSVVNNLKELYAPVALAKDVALNVTGVGSPRVWADRVLFTRLVRNLIDNALKYTSAGEVTIDIAQEQDTVTIRFTDTGQGIATEDQSLIFDEFYQAGNPERNRARGLGLGLSVVNRILPLISGRLSVESTLNIGSCFTLQLPASNKTVPAPQNAETKGTVEKGFLTGRRVLLIEDHQLVQKATRALLESNGAEVLLALDWSGVAQITETAAPDLLVSDLRLPSESGLDIANRLRAVNPELPVVLISGDVTSEIAQQAGQHGYTVLGKPVNVETLLREIQALI